MADPDQGARTSGPAAMRLGQRAVKRAMDLAIGIPLAIIVTPVVAVLAAVLAVQLRGWPFFVHQRLGYFGAPISFVKLRTLPRSTPAYADKTVTKLTPVSRLAKAMRRTHLDELPQLYLVVLGSLSLVGPRPLMLAEAESCGDPSYRTIRTSVPQGCAGLWQISTEKGHRVSDSPEFDLLYVEARSLRLDLWILVRTFLHPFGGRGFTYEELAERLSRTAD